MYYTFSRHGLSPRENSDRCGSGVLSLWPSAPEKDHATALGPVTRKIWRVAVPFCLQAKMLAPMTTGGSLT